ncbi:hypothetical protein FEM48_ZijujUnG0004000 [Ziziphus jujuba var. spinosa]|uniref:Uncharacterized protein n=1 Tax=Ziziphus jujuba var. spinosa TaxID=714518 RepID=A0A978UA34_ZIZJJ|nr:hypothetical protein FEM48_ZijujUnG0004000 [Ziziphus jujuba var. spinosa]
MTRAKSFNMVFERSLVLEIRTTNAKPSFATVLLVCPPISFHRQQLAAFPTHKGFHPMFPLAVSLQRSEIFQRLSSRVVYVVLASFCAAIARSREPNSLGGLPSFKFETILDGLPPTDKDATQDIPSLTNSILNNCLSPFKDLLSKLNSLPDLPPVSCIVSDRAMSFTLDVAQELAIPDVFFWTPSACSFLAYVCYQRLVEKGYTPFKENLLRNPIQVLIRAFTKKVLIQVLSSVCIYAPSKYLKKAPD